MAAPPEDEWKSWDFLERLDWCAQSVSRHGVGVPGWVTVLGYLKLILVHVLFLLLVALRPPTEGLLSMVGAWQAFLRYAVFTHALNAVGEKDGPTRRWSGGVPGLLGLFSAVRYQLRPGTLKMPVFHDMNHRRTKLDVLVHAVFYAVSLVAMFAADPAKWALAVICACDVWFVVFDYGEYLRAHAPTYLGILLCGCYPMAAGGCAGAQVQLMIVWIGSGLAKVGPWFAGVNGTFLCGSYWLSGQAWLWRLMYRAEHDLRPTLFGEIMSHSAATVEWGAPLLLLFTGAPAVVWVGIVGLVAMHLYIIVLCIIDLHVWNFFCAVAAVYLFVGCGTLGFDYKGLAAAPWLPVLYLAFQVLLFFWGSFAPDQVNHQTAHRCWAGNWTQAIWLVRKTAGPKFMQAVPVYGLPPWDPVPEWVKRRGWLGPKAPIPDIAVYKRITFHFLMTLNMKYLPALMRRAMAGEPVSQFHVLHGSAVWDTLFGGVIGSYFNGTQAVMKSLQESAQFEEGECMCLWVGPFPAIGVDFAWGTSQWKIIDAKVGVVATGRLTVEMAKAVASLPSACTRSGGLLDSEGPVGEQEAALVQ
mmetsp:Transcript_8707/g.26811  ORF Transcript_8707/g.26811 Transcript_8707/m.26811 type:complete len:582 (+) Transcript_8707:40-1785(+)